MARRKKANNKVNIECVTDALLIQTLILFRYQNDLAHLDIGTCGHLDIENTEVYIPKTVHVQTQYLILVT